MPVTGNTTHTAPLNRVFYPALDGLRAIAFLMVFLQHYIAMPWGWTGVNIFFVLSGFLITGILFDTCNDAYRVRNFYIRRTLRIFPLYYGIFLIVLLLYPVLHWNLSAAWIAWPLYLGNFLRFLSPTVRVPLSPLQLAADAHLYSSRWPQMPFYLGHFWSLCVEEQFYLVWPWIVFWVRSRRTLIWICGSMVVAAPLARVFAAHLAPTWMLKEELLYRLTPFQLDSLLLGGLIALLWRGAHRDLLLKIARVTVGVCGLATIVYLSSTIRLIDGLWFRNYPYPAGVFTWGLTFVDVFSAGVILCLLRPRGTLSRVLSLSPLRWIGRISYGAYVWHDVFHNFFYQVFGRATSFFWRRILSRAGVHGALAGTVQEPMVVVLSLCATLLLAWFSFRFVESPFLNLKERWTIRAAR